MCFKLYGFGTAYIAGPFAETFEFTRRRFETGDTSLVAALCPAVQSRQASPNRRCDQNVPEGRRP